MALVYAYKGCNEHGDVTIQRFTQEPRAPPGRLSNIPSSRTQKDRDPDAPRS